MHWYMVWTMHALYNVYIYSTDLPMHPTQIKLGAIERERRGDMRTARQCRLGSEHFEERHVRERRCGPRSLRESKRRPKPWREPTSSDAQWRPSGHAAMHRLWTRRAPGARRPHTTSWTRASCSLELTMTIEPRAWCRCSLATSASASPERPNWFAWHPEVECWPKTSRPNAQYASMASVPARRSGL